MSFLQSAFIENTPVARKWLENLGYIGLEFYQTKPFLYSSFSERSNINGKWQEPWFATEDYELINNKAIDCRGNFGLFKIITAQNYFTYNRRKRIIFGWHEFVKTLK